MNKKNLWITQALLLLLCAFSPARADVITNVAIPHSVSFTNAHRWFTEPDPLDFSNHVGYVSLFDGVSLKGWDGHPKFWRVEDGAIIGESTKKNPSGNTYLVYRDLKAKDFTLKFEMKVEGKGGSGFQYRSQTGISWLGPISSTVISNIGSVNLNWMMTGRKQISGRARFIPGSFIPRTRRCASSRGAVRWWNVTARRASGSWATSVISRRSVIW